MKEKGILFALATAVISGVAIYVGKFATTQVGDPFVLTTARNVTVAMLLVALIILPRALPELARLTRKQWLTLALLGGIGGSVPFLLFFYGLSLATAPSAAFMHKTLFLWVALLAFLCLKERPRALQAGALALLVLGNLVVLNWPRAWSFGRGELFVLGATLLWAVEALVARRALQGIGTPVAAFGRMFGGGLIMVAFLGVTGRLGTLAGLDGQQVLWVVGPSISLFGYVLCYYAALKYAPASLVTTILVLASPITSLIYAVRDAQRYTPQQVAGLTLTVVAVLLVAALSRARAPRPVPSGG